MKENSVENIKKKEIKWKYNNQRKKHQLYLEI